MKSALLTCLAVVMFGDGQRLLAKPVDYVRDVKPIFAASCIRCHGAEKQKGGLRLDKVGYMLQGGDSGSALIPGKSQQSRMIIAITGGNEDLKSMPPKEGKLSPQQVVVLKTWIDQGAKAPQDEMSAKIKGKRDHWSFQPIKRVSPPSVKNPSWIRNPIDRFILARLEKEGLTPSRQADRATLIRRLHLDLTGLPPSTATVVEFLADRKPGAYERLVDRLLASPHYGERMARHWLDLARYADSNGFNIDSPRSIWKYRDWVIAAFNRNQSFDEFTIEQIAGDMLPQPTLEQKIATGFHRNTPFNEEGGIDLEQFRVESVVDRVNTTGAVFLGLTVNCGQCHNHKYDPFTQKDYFQLFAFLNNADEPTLHLPTAEQTKQLQLVRAEIAKATEKLKAYDRATAPKLLAWEKNLTPAARVKLAADVQVALRVAPDKRDAEQQKILWDLWTKTDPARAALVKQIEKLTLSEPAIITTLVMAERKEPRQTHIHVGGDFLRKGAKVSPNVPSVIPPIAGKNNPNRLDLARWLVDARNPLTPRVTVNRYWQHFFGLGIVESENDFGIQGTLPSHPELLDWLASEFMAQKWDIKALHRLIVTSATYRQASHTRPNMSLQDPRNKLLARQNRLRLEAEVVRDVALASCGLLSQKIGGPSVFPPQPKGVFAFTQIPRSWKANLGPDRFRRGLYTYFWRSAPFPALTVFDAPDSTTTCTRRNRSNTPLQALTLLNDQAYFEFSRALAARILKTQFGNDRERLASVFQTCLARQPNAQEAKLVQVLLARQLAEFKSSPQEALKLLEIKNAPKIDASQWAAWTMVARVLLNLDEFITRE